MAMRNFQALQDLLNDVGTVDQVGIDERVAKYATRSIKKHAKVFGLKLATAMVDLTTLEGKDTPGKVASLCQKALRPHDDTDIPPTAAVCATGCVVIVGDPAAGAPSALARSAVATVAGSSLKNV